MTIEFDTSVDRPVGAAWSRPNDYVLLTTIATSVERYTLKHPYENDHTHHS